MTTKTKTLAVFLGLALMAAYPMEASANQYTVRDGEREHYEETLRGLGYKDGVGHSDADIAKIAKDIIRANPLFSVKQISPFSSSEFPIVIVGKSPLSAGLVRKQIPLLHPAA